MDLLLPSWSLIAVLQLHHWDQKCWFLRYFLRALLNWLNRARIKYGGIYGEERWGKKLCCLAGRSPTMYLPGYQSGSVLRVKLAECAF